MHTSTLRKVGSSTMLAVPPSLLDALELKAGNTVGLNLEDGHLVIHPIPKPSYTLEELLAMGDATESSSFPEEQEAWLNAAPLGRELL
ncbi:MAG: antitoxin [Magnetococcales bacterium]|nr:antitoxin [Magnetococcales bacterium]NGZ07233.1 antitoxin [Magnetococcales bacterium]